MDVGNNEYHQPTVLNQSEIKHYESMTSRNEKSNEVAELTMKEKCDEASVNTESISDTLERSIAHDEDPGSDLEQMINKTFSDYNNHFDDDYDDYDDYSDYYGKIDDGSNIETQNVTTAAKRNTDLLEEAISLAVEAKNPFETDEQNEQDENSSHDSHNNNNDFDLTATQPPTLDQIEIALSGSSDAMIQRTENKGMNEFFGSSQEQTQEWPQELTEETLSTGSSDHKHNEQNITDEENKEKKNAVVYNFLENPIIGIETPRTEENNAAVTEMNKKEDKQDLNSYNVSEKPTMDTGIPGMANIDDVIVNPTKEARAQSEVAIEPDFTRSEEDYLNQLSSVPSNLEIRGDINDTSDKVESLRGSLDSFSDQFCLSAAMQKISKPIPAGSYGSDYDGDEEDDNTHDKRDIITKKQKKNSDEDKAQLINSATIDNSFKVACQSDKPPKFPANSTGLNFPEITVPQNSSGNDVSIPTPDSTPKIRDSGDSITSIDKNRPVNVIHVRKYGMHSSIVSGIDEFSLAEDSLIDNSPLRQHSIIEILKQTRRTSSITMLDQSLPGNNELIVKEVPTRKTSQNNNEEGEDDDSVSKLNESIDKDCIFRKQTDEESIKETIKTSSSSLSTEKKETPLLHDEKNIHSGEIEKAIPIDEALPNINERKKIEPVDLWASPRLYELYCQLDLENQTCADCFVALTQPNSIYASFYINPDLRTNSDLMMNEIFNKRNNENTKYLRFSSLNRQGSMQSFTKRSSWLFADNESDTDSENSLFSTGNSSVSDNDGEGQETERKAQEYSLKNSARTFKISNKTTAKDDESDEDAWERVKIQNKTLSFKVKKKETDTNANTYFGIPNIVNKIKRKKSPQYVLENTHAVHVAGFENLHETFRLNTSSFPHYVNKSRQSKNEKAAQKLRGNLRGLTKSHPQSTDHSKQGAPKKPQHLFVQPHGVFICQKCARAHSLLGRAVTTVKSVYKTVYWSKEELEIMEKCGGNLYSRKILTAHIPKHWEGVNSSDDDTDSVITRVNIPGSALNGQSTTLEERLTYARAKYELHAFILPANDSSLNKNKKKQAILDENSRWQYLFKNKKSQNGVSTTTDSTLNSSDGGTSGKVRLPDRLIDYFCVIGATKTPKKTTSIPLDSSSQHHVSSIQLKAKVWDCYPSPQSARMKPHADMPLPPSLCEFAFPNGCKPSTHKKDPSFFNFCLSMEYTNTRVYASALMVYEDIVDLEQIMKCLKEGGFENAHVVTKNSRKKKSRGSWGSATSLSNDPSAQNNDKTTPSSKVNPSDKKLFLPKVFVILSHYPLCNLHRTFLLQIYLLSKSKSSAVLPVERYISNLFDIPLPPPGKIRLKYGYFAETEKMNCFFHRPAKNQLPLVGFSFRPLFTSLSVGNILVVFACLVREMKVVLCCKHLSILTPCAEALLSFLFPFVWQGLYLPLLPSSMLDILESPVPYLVGIHSRLLPSIRNRSSNTVYVDLDKDIVHLGFEKGETISIERKTLKLPEKETEKLRSKIEQFGGLAYLPPLGNQKGRVTQGYGNETILNAKREPYAVQTTMTPNPEHGNTEEKKYSLFKNVSQSNMSAKSDIYSQLRASILGKADEAYVNGEHNLSVHFSKKSLGVGARFRKEKKEPEKEKYRTKDTDTSYQRKNKSLLDTEYDEEDGFSQSEIRHAFLRFFAVLLRNYERYVLTTSNTSNSVSPDKLSPSSSSRRHLGQTQNEIFDSFTFLKKSADDSKTWDFLAGLISTRMFEQFIREKIEDPTQNEILLFDETIILRKNVSKKNKLKGTLKKTPFLSDVSDWDLETFVPPPPSTLDLPSTSSGSNTNNKHGKKFPRLRSGFFGFKKKVQKWPSETYQRRVASPSFLYDPVLSKLYLTSPYSNLPDRDLHWAIFALSYRHMFCTDRPVATSIPISYVNPYEPSADQLSQYSFIKSNYDQHEKVNNSLRAIIASRSAVFEAKGIITQSKNKTHKILWSVAKVQATYRMHKDRILYQEFIRPRIISLQRTFRDRLFRKRYGSTFKVLTIVLECFLYHQGTNQKAIVIQKVFRAYIDRRKSSRRAWAVLIIHLRLKSYRLRLRFLKMKYISTWLSSVKRSRRDRLSFLMLNSLVTKLQSLVRGYSTRKQVSLLRKERLLCYRTQLFELWKRAYTPLSYRSKFWKILNKNCFLYLSLHEEELKRLWDALDILASPNDETTVFERCLQIQSLIDASKKKVDSNVTSTKSTTSLVQNKIVPIFPAELVKRQESSSLTLKKKQALDDAKSALNAERQKMYSILKQLDRDTQQRIFQLFNLDYSEDRKKERIVKSLWEYRNLIKPSISFVSSLYDEYGNLHNFAAHNRNGKKVLPPPSVMKRFELNMKDPQTKEIVNRASRNKSVFIQGKLENRMKYDLVELGRACLIALSKTQDMMSVQKQYRSRSKTLPRSKYQRQTIKMVLHNPRAKRELRGYLTKFPGNGVREKRRYMIQSYLFG